VEVERGRSVATQPGFDLLRPDPAGTIQSLASLGYSPEAAIADLVDNSLAAKARHVDIEFHWGGADGSWVVLRDDGVGMTLEELLRGLTVGGRGLDDREASDLGRFGMGLKTASFSQARQVIVASKAKGHEWNVRTWDTEYVIEVGDWLLQHGAPAEAEAALQEEQGRLKASGTIVMWRHLTRLVAEGSEPGDQWAQKEFYKLLDLIVGHLGMVFSRYLSGQAPYLPGRAKLSLTVNGHPVPSWDPFLGKQKFVEQLAMEIPLPGVRVQGFVMPHKSRLTDQEYLEGGGPRGWLAQQGFYVYRRDRLIVAGDWLKLGDFRQDERHSLARISVELPPEQDLDWALDVKKSTAMPPPAMVGHLRRVAKATRDRAGAVTNHKGRVVRDRQTSSVDFTWKVVKQFGRTRFVVNREHPLLRDLFERAPDARSAITDVLNMVEKTLPIGLIQSTSDVAEMVGFVDEEIPDDVMDMARRMLEVLLNRGEMASVALSRVARMPPFSEYPHLSDVLSGVTAPTTFEERP
jgi:hypothetical protein